MFNNIGNGAVQDVAEDIQGLGGDGLAFFHTVNGVGGNTMLKDQLCSYEARFQRMVCMISCCRIEPPDKYYKKSIILNSLTIPNRLTIK